MNDPTPSPKPPNLEQPSPEGLAAVPCSGRVGAEIGTDDAWPANLMCRLLLPVPVKELAAIGDALAKIARKKGKEARMKQVGQTLEIFTVQNKPKPKPSK